MEPVSVTLGLIVARLVAKALDKTADRAAEAGVGVLTRLMDRLRERLGGEESPAKVALARVEDAPDSPARIGQLAETLDQRAAHDRDFRTALEALVAEARTGGVDIGAVTQTAWGNQNVQNAGVTDSAIITYGQPPPTPGP